MENNKIYKGDCYELIKQIPDKSIDLIYTDVPYLLENHGYGKSDLGQRIKKKDNELNKADKIAKLKQEISELQNLMDNATSKDEYEKYHCRKSNKLCNLNLLEKQDITKGFDYAILDEFVRVMKHIYIYIWCSKDQIYDLMDYFVGKHKCRFNLLVWCKTNPTPATNNCWLPNIEHCLVFKSEDAPSYNDGYNLKSKWYMSGTNVNDKKDFVHPTIKPMEFVKQHLLHSTQPNDVILDPFLGSGTTAVACKELGRQFIGFEINDEYYNIACDRLNGIDQKGQTNLFETNYEQLDMFKQD